MWQCKNIAWGIDFGFIWMYLDGFFEILSHKEAPDMCYWPFLRFYDEYIHKYKHVQSQPLKPSWEQPMPTCIALTPLLLTPSGESIVHLDVWISSPHRETRHHSPWLPNTSHWEMQFNSGAPFYKWTVNYTAPVECQTADWDLQSNSGTVVSFILQANCLIGNCTFFSGRLLDCHLYCT